MLNLKQKVAAIENARKKYRAMLNQSRYKAEVEQIVWDRTADSCGRLDLTTEAKNDTSVFGVYRKGVKHALDTVRSVAEKEPLCVDRIMDLHTQILQYSDPSGAGHFRRMRAHWLQSTMILANWEKIPDLMENLIYGINHHQVPAFYWSELPDAQFQSMSRHPVMEAIEANYNTVAIHPFQDGNKRTARMVSSWILHKAGYIPFTIDDREAYISGIESYYNTRRGHSFYEFLFDQMMKSYDIATNDVRQADTIYSIPKHVKTGKKGTHIGGRYRKSPVHS